MTNLNGWKMGCALLALSAVTALTSPAQTFTTLVRFNPATGYSPDFDPMVQGFDGSLYGTAMSGGANNYGTVFKLTPNGDFRILHSFNLTGGAYPQAGLVLATDGGVYGTTSQGGAYNGNGGDGGTVFKITRAGTFITLYSFCAKTNCADGELPGAGLVEANDGNFYGLTSHGGDNSAGTIFEISAEGTLTTLYSFCAQSNCSDGLYPSGPLIQGVDGGLYGATSYGGTTNSASCPRGCGTMFKITPAGMFTHLYSFCALATCADGYYPNGGLVQAIDGAFYGTTEFGGTGGCMTAGVVVGCGTVFRVTSNGLTTLYNFCDESACGRLPFVGVVQGTDGGFYGTTGYGGSENVGTLFEITPEGTATTLYSFCTEPPCTDGYYPFAALLQATDGKFYGTTFEGGDRNSQGTAFSLDMGLGPFLSLIRNPAKVGQTFGILGQAFVGTTSVSLNGTNASFTVKASTLIEAVVPSGATTGFVTVTTPTGVLTSNVPFHVIP